MSLLGSFSPVPLPLAGVRQRRPPAAGAHAAARLTAGVAVRAAARDALTAAAAAQMARAEPVRTAAGLPNCEFWNRPRLRRLSIGPRQRRANQRAMNRALVALRTGRLAGSPRRLVGGRRVGLVDRRGRRRQVGLTVSIIDVDVDDRRVL